MLRKMISILLAVLTLTAVIPFSVTTSFAESIDRLNSNNESYSKVYRETETIQYDTNVEFVEEVESEENMSDDNHIEASTESYQLNYQNATDSYGTNSLAYVGATNEYIYGSFKYTVSGESVTITGYTGGEENVTLPSIIEGKVVNSIGSKAFLNSSILTAVIIPNSVTTIGQSAFQNCSNLKSVKLSKSVTEIGGGAFAYCNNLVSIEIPKSLETTTRFFDNNAYKYGVFYGCDNLKNVTFEAGTTRIANDLFANSGIEKIVIPDTVTSIDSRAFENCAMLTSVEMPNSVKSIGSSAFVNCTALASVIIPDTVTTIGESAFQNCSNLKSVKLSKSVTEIGGGAFAYCNNLVSIEIPKSLETTTRFFDNNAYKYGVFYGCDNLKNVTFEVGTTRIANDLFANSGIEKIVIPDTVTSIDSRAFENCAMLTSIKIPGSVTTISSSAFSGCSNLSAYCPKYSNATILLMDLGINVISDYDLRLKPSNVIMDDESYFEMLSGESVSIVCNYSIRNEAFDRISNPSIKIKIPENAFIKMGSMYFNNKSFSGFTETDTYVTIPVTESSGRITFKFELTGECNLRTYATLNYKLNGSNQYDIIDVINDDISVLSIHTDRVTSSDKISISGIAPKSGKIDVYVDGVHNTQLIANKAGNYNGTVVLSNPENEKKYNIKAVTRIEEEEVLSETSVVYMENAPELESFTMTYNGKVYDMMSNNRNHITFILEKYHGAYPFKFEAKYINPESVGKVYISSVRNQVKKTVDAEWNETSQSFVFEGYFDENNHDYVPGNIILEYTKQYEEPYTIGQLQNEYNKIVAENPEVFDDIEYIATPIAENTIQYDYNLEKIKSKEELGFDMLRMTVETIGNSGSEDWADLIGVTNSAANDIYSYFFDEGSDKYYLHLDYSDPKTWVMMTYDVSSSTIVKYGIKALTDGREYSFTPSALENLSDGLSMISTVLGPVNKKMDISDDYDKLVDNIYASGMSIEEREIALKKAEELKRDKEMYLITTMAMSVLTMGAGCLPCALIMGSIGVLSDFFFQNRVAGILNGRYFQKANWSIDPSGYVYAGVTTNRIPNAKATAWWIPYDEDNENFWSYPDVSKAQIWDASEYSQSNPQTTDNNGNYAWDVPEGLWKVVVEKDGYETYSTEWLPVPPPQTDVNINLKSKVIPELMSADYQDGRVLLTFSEYMNPDALRNIKIEDFCGTNVNYMLSYSKDEKDDIGNVFTKEYQLIFEDNYDIKYDYYEVIITDAESYSGVKMSTNVVIGKKPEVNPTEPSEPYVSEVTYILGDANGDGKINVKDATQIQKAVAGIIVLDGSKILAADVDGNGKVNVRDATVIQKFCADIEIKYPIGKEITA